MRHFNAAKALLQAGHSPEDVMTSLELSPRQMRIIRLAITLPNVAQDAFGKGQLTMHQVDGLAQALADGNYSNAWGCLEGLLAMQPMAFRISGVMYAFDANRIRTHPNLKHFAMADYDYLASELALCDPQSREALAKWLHAMGLHSEDLCRTLATLMRLS